MNPRIRHKLDEMSERLQEVQLLLAQPETLSDGARFREAMDDDFNTPEAMAALYDLATELNRHRDPALEGQLRALAGGLGLLQRPLAEVRRGGLRGRADAPGAVHDDAAIEALIARRAAAKKARDFATADQLRAELLAQGVLLEDTAAGTAWRRA